MGKLTAQQEAFCREYCVDFNGAGAARRAQYSEKTAKEQGSQQLAKPEVQARVRELMDARLAKIDKRADAVLKELERIGYVDPLPILTEDGAVKHLKDWPEDLRRALQSIDVQETFEMEGSERVWTGYIKKIKFWDKPKSLELLGKSEALFKDKVEHSGSLTLEALVAGSGQKKVGGA